jgi:hypothetical protein
VADTKPADTVPALTETAPGAPAGPSRVEVGVLLVLSLLWLAATLRVADRLILANRTNVADLATAVSLALPTVVNASLVAGAAAGLAASLLRIATTGAPGQADQIRRGLVGTGGAVIVGLVASGLILLRYGHSSSTVVLAVTVGVAALVGGFASALPRAVLAAAVTGTLAIFLIGVFVGLFQDSLTSMLGGTAGDPGSQVRAASWLSILTTLLQGLVVGLTAYSYLRRRVDSPRWPVFALGGALPGVFLLAGLGLSIVGGSGLSNLSGALSEADQLVRDLSDGAGFNQALVTAFVGAIIAMIAVGRTMRREPDVDELDA